jgi:hypothetical protein
MVKEFLKEFWPIAAIVAVILVISGIVNDVSSGGCEVQVKLHSTTSHQ